VPSRLGLADLASLAFDAVVQDVQIFPESTIWDADMVPYTNRLVWSILPSICWAITTRTGQSTNTTSCGAQSSAVFAGAH
jgi:hypothetical protein